MVIFLVICGTSFLKMLKHINIMKFPGFVSHESILHLKYDNEVRSMLKYIADCVTLVKDKDEMLGLFAADLKLLLILPGIKATFKRFISKVEVLIPSPNKRKNSTTASYGNEHQKKRCLAKTYMLTKEAKVTTTVELTKCFEKWLENKIIKKSKVYL